MDPLEHVRELVAECIARLPAEGEAVIEEICTQNPQHAEVIRARLSSLEHFGFLGDEPTEEDYPERLDEYRLLRRIGGGGMGVVFEAMQESLGRPVALKVIRADQAFHPQARQRFRREVEAVAQLSHPGIVPVYTVGEDGGVPYFTMELVEGCTLAEALERLQGRKPAELTGEDLWRVLKSSGDPGEGAASASEAPEFFRRSWSELSVRIVHAVTESLLHAHARGVLHRDLKPSNIMITAEGRVLLFDFGLASTQSSSRITRTGSLLGSMPYMAPELLGGDAEVDECTDVYSLGVTLFEMLTLRLPFEKRQKTGVPTQALRELNPSVRRWNPAVPWDAETVCLTAMEIDRGRRYADADGLHRDLSNVLQLRSIEAQRPSPPLRLRRLMQRHPAISVGVVLGLILAVTSVVFAVWQARLNREIRNTLAKVSEAERQAAGDRDLARLGLQQAQKAIDRLLAQVGEVLLVDVPQMTEVRKRLVRDAVELTAELASRKGSDPNLRVALAAHQQRLGRVLLEMGQPGEALEQLQSAWELAENLEVELDPAAMDWRLALLAKDIGDVLTTREDPEFEEWYHRSLERFQSQLDTSADARFHSVDLHSNLGVMAMQAGDHEQGLTHFEQAEALSADLVDRSPDNLQYLEQRSAVLINLGSLHANDGDFELAEQFFEEAREPQELLVQDNPGNASLSKAFAFASGTLGKLRLEQHRMEEALMPLLDAVMQYERLVNDYPRMQEYRLQLSNWRYELSLAHLALEEPDKAESLLRDSIRNLDGHPALARPDVRRCLARSQSKLASLLDSAEAHRLFRKAADHYESLTTGSGDTLTDRWGLVEVCFQLASMEESHAEQARRSQQSFAASLTLLSRQPFDERTPALAERCCGQLLDLLALDQDWQAAIQVARRLAECEDAAPRMVRVAAALLGDFARSWQQDAPDSEAGKALETAALDLLQRALDIEVVRFEELTAAADLEGLRSLPGFVVVATDDD